MKISFTVGRTFSASHQPLHDGSIGRHGHDFRVEVTVAGSNYDLGPALNLVTDELEGRSLEDMMPGAETAVSGIASWFVERLALTFPKLTRVTVWEGANRYATVDRELR